MLWLYTAAYVALAGTTVWLIDDEISLLGWILSLLFGAFFLFGAGSYGHQAKWAVDAGLKNAIGRSEETVALIKRVVAAGPVMTQDRAPIFTAPLWFAMPQADAEHGAEPKWDSLTMDRLKRLG